MFDNSQLQWRGNRLRLRNDGASPVVEVVPDSRYPNMWRVRAPSRPDSDLVNRTLAREAARSILLSILNSRETPPEAAPIRFADKSVPEAA
jgi:hypothetical protein